MNAVFESPEALRLLEKVDEKIGILVLATGVNEQDHQQFAYIRIPPSKYLAFKSAENRGNYNVADYGEVLMHGLGVKPPMSVQEEMHHRYGAAMDFEKKLTKIFAQAAGA
jgi:hypothetical protein